MTPDEGAEARDRRRRREQVARDEEAEPEAPEAAGLEEQRPGFSLPPAQRTDAETQDLLRNLRRQQRVHYEQRLAEARELERRAKELQRRVKAQQKLRADAAKHAEYVKSLAPQLGMDLQRPITEVPPFDPAQVEQVEFTTIQEARSYVRILYDKTSRRYLYEVIEPALTVTEEEVLDFLRDTLVRTLEGRHDPDTDWEDYLQEAIERAIVDHAILVDEVSKQRIKYFLLRDFLGYGRIDVLMRDPMIEDISCDGPNIPLYLFHRQYESVRTSVRFPHERDLDAFVIRLAQRSGKHISIAEPILDATLPDTSRLQATLSREVTTRGSSFTIRKFRADPLTPPDLIRLGTVSPELAAFFWFAMEHGQSLIYAGGTASGKTTTLNAMSQFIPPQKKIVSIEDTREINLPHENWIAGLTRRGFGGEVGPSGKPAGTIDMYRLLEAALRQRPEYLLVGEVRGQEAQTLFQAMATGHATYSTLHADSVTSAVYRLENPPIQVPRIMLQTLDAMAVQVQVRLKNRLARRMKEVVEILGIDPASGDLLTNTAFLWDPKEDRYTYLGKSHILERIQELTNLTAAAVDREWQQRTEVLAWMVGKGIRHIRDVADIVSAYYSDPEGLMAQVRAHPAPAAGPGAGPGPGAGAAGEGGP